jgi:hypothetical protein
MAKSCNDYRAPGAIPRLPGENWVDFDARQRQHRIDNTVPKPRKRTTRARAAATGCNRKRNADHVDGFDRDNIGLSPDF